jgi:hypothetical protein
MERTGIEPVTSGLQGRPGDASQRERALQGHGPELGASFERPGTTGGAAAFAPALPPQARARPAYLSLSPTFH